jgi:hypothetical protein
MTSPFHLAATLLTLVANLAVAQIASTASPAAADAPATEGPLWVAMADVACGKYHGVVWAGVSGADTFVRFYNARGARKQDFVFKDDEVYHRGKTCDIKPTKLGTEMNSK